MSTGRFDYVLQASASGFTSEVQKAERSVDGLDKSQKNAKRSGDDWSKGTEKLTTAFKALGVGLAVASAAGAVIFNKMIAATIEQDRVMAQLNATLKSTGGAAGKTASDLAKTAAELQKITTYGDEAIISAQSLLLTFKEIKGDNFDRTTKAVLDMSTAMGTDLKSAAIQLGKALNDPATQLSALSRSGVSFSESQKEMVKAMVESGNIAEAQTLILKELESQFGGSAEAARNTLGGALEGLKNNWGDLFEVQGQASEGMVDSINTLNQTISDPQFKESMDAILNGLIGIVNFAAKGAAAIAFLYQTIAGTREKTLVDLGEEIDTVSTALANLEKNRRGSSATAIKYRAQLVSLQKAYDAEVKAINSAGKSITALSPIIVTATERTASFATATEKSSTALIKKAASCSKAATEVAKLSPIIVTATRKAEVFGTANVSAAEETSEAWESARSTLSDFFFEMARDGNNAFDTLVKGFKAMIVKMLAEAAANRILLAVGIGATSAGAAAGSASSLLSGGSFLAGLSGGIAEAGQGFYEGIGTFASNNGLTGIGDAAYTKGLNTSLTSIGLDIGGGLVGSFLGTKAFGETSGIGAGIGGIAGSIAIPIPGLGAGIGSFIGSALESLFGQDNNGNNAASASFNLGTGASSSRGIGNSFDQANVDGANTLVRVLQSFSNAIGGSTLSNNLEIGNKNGIKYNNVSYGQDVEAFLQVAFDDIIKSATNLKESLKPLILSFEGASGEIARFANSIASIDSQAGINTVTNAIEQFNAVQPSIANAYQDQTDALQLLIDGYDGSLSASEQLAASLFTNKVAAYEFALAIQSVGRSLSDQAEAQAASIRESVMSPQEILDRRIGEAAFLRQGLDQQTDPILAAEITRRYLELNRLIFDGITDEQQISLAELFAGNAESANEVLQRILQGAVDGLENTQNSINEQVATMLQSAGTGLLEAAEAQQRAAETTQSAAELLRDVLNNFNPFNSFRYSEIGN